MLQRRLVDRGDERGILLMEWYMSRWNVFGISRELAVQSKLVEDITTITRAT
jgi:hypothetical protein